MKNIFQVGLKARAVTEITLRSPSTVPFRSVRPSRVTGLCGLAEIGSRSQVTAQLAGVEMWFKK